MPRSKTRKRKKGSRAYIKPSQRQRPKPSPSWYPFFFLGLMGIGVLIIVLNYVELIPFTSGTEPVYLWVGLTFIAAGFLAATRYR